MTQDDYVVMKKTSREKLIKELKDVKKENQQLKKQKDDVVEYIKFLVIFNQNINGKFSNTLWGQEILELLGEIDEENIN